MTVPDENRKIMRSLGREDDYDYSRPAFIPERVNLTSYIGAKSMLDRSQEFNVFFGEAISFVMGPRAWDFMLSGDSALHKQQRKTMANALYHDGWHKQIQTFYEDITLQLLSENSYKLAGTNQVDITRDVGNLAHCHFAASVFSLPMKTKENPRGIFSEHEVWALMALMFTAVFFDFDPLKSFPLRHAARAFGKQLGKLIEVNVKATKATGILSGVVDSFRESHDALKTYGVHMIRKLLESGLNPEEIGNLEYIALRT
jgi:linoleate 10R-lipoxygenase